MSPSADLHLCVFDYSLSTGQLEILASEYYGRCKFFAEGKVVIHFQDREDAIAFDKALMSFA